MGLVVRTFIGIPLPKPQAETLARLQRKLAIALPNLRWTNPSQYHLTIAFLGDVQTELLDGLFASVANAASGFSPSCSSSRGWASFPMRRGQRFSGLGFQERICRAYALYGNTWRRLLSMQAQHRPTIAFIRISR